jgi:hypothetical protein
MERYALSSQFVLWPPLAGACVEVGTAVVSEITLSHSVSQIVHVHESNYYFSWLVTFPAMDLDNASAKSFVIRVTSCHANGVEGT